MIINEVPLTAVWQLRQQVMYPDHSIETVQLDNDESGIHLGLIWQKELVSVISLFVSEQELQFRKFATKAAFQNKGFGTALLQYVMEWAEVNRCTLVWCNARSTATGLYNRFGMVPVGDTWTKNGIVYIKMQKQL